LDPDGQAEAGRARAGRTSKLARAGRISKPARAGRTSKPARAKRTSKPARAKRTSKLARAKRTSKLARGERILELARCGVATVHEASGRQGLIDVPLVQIVPGSRAAGRARTVRCGQGDNLMVHAALSEVQPGEVLVLTMPDPAPVALVGELIALQARYRKVAGILVDAAVRDVDELAALGLPIWARWIRATGATKDVAGAINVPVTVGGMRIAPGDIVVMDADGAVVVPAAREAEVLEATADRERHEDEAREQYRRGLLTYDLMGLRAKVEGQASRIKNP
jgi:4-hydroxy-4-methyl-2-oxoglutarate aldolase